MQKEIPALFNTEMVKAVLTRNLHGLETRGNRLLSITRYHVVYNNPDPVEVAAEIRRNLRSIGLNNRDVNVRAGWTLRVKTQNAKAKNLFDEIYLQVLYAYQAHMHNWLIVKVDNHYVSMPGALNTFEIEIIKQKLQV